MKNYYKLIVKPTCVFLQLAIIIVGCVGTSQIQAQEVGEEFFGSAAQDHFGGALSCFGRKILVGTPSKPLSVNSNVGGAILLQPSLNTKKTIPIPSNTFGSERFGKSVLIVPDVNNDGTRDYAVGVPGLLSSGGVFLHEDPGASQFSTADNQFAATQSFEQFGFSLASTGDVSSTLDGVADLAIGIPSRSGSNGAVTIVELNSSAGAEIRTINGMDAESFGYSLSSISDLNENNVRDIVVGAPEFVNSSTAVVGRIAAIDPSTAATIFSIEGDDPSVYFGYSVANAGDVDGDGFADIIVGAPNRSIGSLLSVPSVDDPKVIGKSPDFNNSSPGDNLIDNNIGGRATTGSAYLISGDPNASSKVLCYFGDQSDFGQEYGYAVAGVGDLNTDGQLDFAVSSPDTDNDTGKVFVYSFIEGICVEQVSYSGSAVGERFGISLGGSFQPPGLGCDFDNDSISDFAIGTQSDSVAENAGSVLIINGTAPEQALPTAAMLRAKISRIGVLEVALALNREPFGECTGALFSRFSIGLERTRISHVHSGLASEQEFSAVVSGLPNVKFVKGFRPVVHFIAKIKCGEEPFFVSNVVSRFINCGLEESTSLEEWFEILKRDMQLSSAEQQIKYRKFKRAQRRKRILNR